MKILVLNSSGNVGKSTITQLFSSNLSDVQIIEVETQNKGNSEVEGLNVLKYKAGDDFMTIYEPLMFNENVIVDVGASNLGNFVDQLSEMAGITDVFVHFIIPTTSFDKVQTDTYKTIRLLRSFDVPDSKINVVFNLVEKSVENDFKELLNADFDFNKNLFIPKSSIFKELGFLRTTIHDVYHPELDHYARFMLSTTDRDVKAGFLKKDIINKMIHKIKGQLDYIFQAVTGMAPIPHKDEIVTAEVVSKAEKPKGKKQEQEQGQGQGDKLEEMEF